MDRFSALDVESARGELSLRAVILGCFLTSIFAAANVYLALRVGLSFSTCIPAAVIAMTVFRALGGASIRESNIVQTIASSAGALASIIFVLPGLVMIGWWATIPFWTTALICVCGGTIGVMLSIPLRRALVAGSDLPFPEGRAAAEVLREGSRALHLDDGVGDSDRGGLASMVCGTIISAGFALLSATRLIADHVASWARLGAAASGIELSFSFALFGVGHLVGRAVGLAMLLGLCLGFGIATPLLTWLQSSFGAPEAVAMDVWRHQVRFLGAGAIGAAAIWQVGSLVIPVIRGLSDARLTPPALQGPLQFQDRDIPMRIAFPVTLILLVPICIQIAVFVSGSPLARIALPLSLAATGYVLFASILVAAVSGYMAGLIGASNSPLSGVAILAVLGASALLLPVLAIVPTGGQALVSCALFVTAIVVVTAAISNDNLQDLKTGQLIGATPWKQQVALVLGVVAGAATIPPVLELLRTAYGFGLATGIQPHALAAPQATLMTDLAKGVIGNDLDWRLIGVGVVLGLCLIALDHALERAGRTRLPPLAVGIGIYLPMGTILAVAVGALVGDRWLRRHGTDAAERRGTLLASGLIVGESIMGVILATLAVTAGRADPLAFSTFGTTGGGQVIGALIFFGLLALCYVRTGKRIA